MAIVTGIGRAVWYDVWDISDHLTAADMVLSQDAPEITTLPDTFHVHVGGGLKTAVASGQGYFEAASSGGGEAIDDIFDVRLGVSGAVLSMTPGASTVGSVCYSMDALATQHVPLPGDTVGEVQGFSFACVSGNLAGTAHDAGAFRGIIQANSALTASGNSTGNQLGILAAGQEMRLAYHIQTVSGTNPTIDITVESDDSSGFSSAATQITVTQKTARSAAIQVKAGAVADDDWWRLKWVIGGTDTPTFLLSANLGIITLS